MLIYVLFSVYSTIDSKEKALSCQFNKLVKHSHYLKTLTTYYTLPITIILILNKNILKLKLNKYIIGKLKLLPIIISNSRTDGKDPCPIFRLFFSPAELELGGFAVPAGKLGFSVGVFCVCACSCFALLQFRRRTIGGELGGPKRLQKISFGVLVFLWFMYVLLSSLQAYSLI